MLRPEEHIKRAEELCARIRSASTLVGSREKTLVKGADPNELKKILSFVLANRRLLTRQGNLLTVRDLLHMLQNSNFSKRSGSTPAYYKNIQTAFGSGLYSTNVDDALQILGWACRLL